MAYKSAVLSRGALRIGPGLVVALAIAALGAPVLATNVCGALSGTLAPSGNPWTISCDSTIEPADQLIVEPGAELFFDPGVKLQIFGELLAIGTAAQPITISSNAVVPAPGDYATVELSGTATLAHAILQHGTGWSVTGEFALDQSEIRDQLDADSLAALVLAAGSKGTVSDSTFDNPGRPIAMAHDVEGTFSALQFAAGHVARSIYVLGGIWTQSQTWTNGDVPYEIAGHIGFGAGTTQTFEPGVIFKIASVFATVLEFDNLQITGSSTTPTVFTSIDDDDFGGDTYGDGPGSPSPGDYGGIRVIGTASILGAVFLYGEGLTVEGHADVGVSLFQHLLGAEFSLAALNFTAGSSGSVSTVYFNQNRRPLRLGIDADVGLTDLIISSAHTVRSILVLGGTWTHSRTWSDFGVPYEMGGTTFAAPSTQTVEPGVVFKLWPSAHLQFDELTVNGTADQPVVFTARDDDEFGGDIYGDGPQPTGAGDYERIHIYGTAAVEHALFRFGSGIAVVNHADFDHVTVEVQTDVSSCAAIDFDFLSTGSVVDSHFRDTCLPVRLAGNANPALSGLTVESQSFAEAVLVENGFWTIDRAWSDPGLPYYLPSGLFIASETVHSVEPGVVFKVGMGRVEMVDPIQGTPARPIVFTSFRDDTVAGDTNVDGPSAGAPGDWDGLRLYGGGEWGHLDVRYAETGLSTENGFPSGSVRDSVFRFNATGLRIAHPIHPWTVTDSQFVSNGIGVSIDSSADITLGDLSDMDPTNDGRNLFACNVVHAENVVFPSVPAENNWWGSAPPVGSLIVGEFDTDPFLTDSRSGALTLLRVARSGVSDVSLTWDDVAPACGYRVLRSTQPVSGFIDLSGPIPGAGFIDIGAASSPDDAYYLVPIE